LYQRNPINDPTKAAIKLSFPRIRDIHNIQIIKKIIFETNVKIPSANTDTAEVPAANPSIPSVKLAPLDTAVIYKNNNWNKINQAHFSYPSPVHANNSA
jgi:hypothetical protein